MSDSFQAEGSSEQVSRFTHTHTHTHTHTRMQTQPLAWLSHSTRISCGSEKDTCVQIHQVMQTHIFLFSFLVHMYL